MTEPITAEDLHAAADHVSHAQDHVELGFREGALEQFVEASNWWEPPALGLVALSIDPLSLALGVSIGVVAARGAP